MLPSAERIEESSAVEIEIPDTGDNKAEETSEAVSNSTSTTDTCDGNENSKLDNPPTQTDAIEVEKRALHAEAGIYSFYFV